MLFAWFKSLVSRISFHSKVLLAWIGSFLLQIGCIPLFKQPILFIFVIELIGVALTMWMLCIYTNRIKRLRNDITAIVSGNNYAPILFAGNDDIGKLAININRILQYTETLSTQQCQMRESMKDVELQVLQSQINPHFLYNSLDMIHWQALLHNMSDISYAVENLASFYRFSLAMGKNKVSIEKELMHVQAYVNVQNIRYGNKIQLTISVPAELLHYQIVKITLQPLVENCIQHGIRARTDSQGTITISAEQIGGEILFSIEDNGIGMNAKQLETIGESKTRDHGFGINNINQRLNLNYGPAYGLHYESTVGIGTKAQFRIPLETSPSPLEAILDHPSNIGPFK